MLNLADQSPTSVAACPLLLAQPRLRAMMEQLAKAVLVLMHCAWLPPRSERPRRMLQGRLRPLNFGCALSDWRRKCPSVVQMWSASAGGLMHLNGRHRNQGLRLMYLGNQGGSGRTAVIATPGQPLLFETDMWEVLPVYLFSTARLWLRALKGT